MWEDLNFNQKVEIAKLYKKHGIKNFSQVKDLYNSFHSNTYDDGGQANPMNYEHVGTIYSNDLKNQGITHVANLPEVIVKGQKPHEYRSSFKGYQEYLPDLVSFVPVAGDLQDAVNAVKEAYNGNYSQAAITGATLLLPNMLEKPARFLRNRFGKEIAQSAAEAVSRKRPKLVADTTGKPYYTADDIPDVIDVNRAPEGKFHHQDELKLDDDYDFTEGHINDGAGHISSREYYKQFNDAFNNAKHGQAVAFLKDKDLSFDSYADIASFLAKQQQKGRIKLVKAHDAPAFMELNSLGKIKFPDRKTRVEDMNNFLDRLNDKYGTSYKHVEDRSYWKPWGPTTPQVVKNVSPQGVYQHSYWLEPLIAVKLENGGLIK